MAELVEDGARFARGLVAGMFSGAVLVGLVALRRSRQESSGPGPDEARQGRSASELPREPTLRM